MLKRGIYLVLVILFSFSSFAITGDFNNDNCVKFDDFLTFADGLKKFTEKGIYDKTFDLDKDNKIGLGDFLMFAENYEKCEEAEVESECNDLEDINEKNYCLDLEAVQELDENICNGISDSELRDLCKYRVNLFAGKDYSPRRVRGFHTTIGQVKDMNLNSVLKNAKEFSLYEYDAIIERDKDFVLGDEQYLFIITAPEGQKFASISFVRDGDGMFYNVKGFESKIITDKEVYVRIKEGGQEYVTYEEYKNSKKSANPMYAYSIPVVDNKVSFIIFGPERTALGQVFTCIKFAEKEEDFWNPNKIWDRSCLGPDGVFRKI